MFEWRNRLVNTTFIIVPSSEFSIEHDHVIFIQV